MSPGELIYSRHFPPSGPSVKEAEKALRKGKRTPLWAEFREQMKQRERRLVCVERPGRIEGSRQFIDLAKQLAETSRTDIAIWDCETEVCVFLYSACSWYKGEEKELLCTLLQQCDDVVIAPRPKLPNEWEMILMYQTHDYTFSEREPE